MAAGATAALLAALAQAAPPAADPPPALPAAAVDQTEIVGLFKEVCVGAFPDEAAVGAALAGHAATAMSAVELKDYLHDDPGRGWFVKPGATLYAITIENPPFHTCAVRMMTPVGPAGAAQFVKLVDDYVAANGARRQPAQKRTFSNDGVDMTAFGLPIVDAAGHPTDLFGLFLDNYHGRVPPKWRDYATPGIGVAVRYARQRIAGEPAPRR